MLPEFQSVLTRRGSGVLYSTILLTPGIGALANQSFLFFAYGKGQQATGFAAGTVSTYCETNLKGQGGAIPGQMAFVAHGLTLSYSNFTARAPVSSADMHNLIDNGVVLLWGYQDTEGIVISPTASIPSGSSLMGIAGTNGGQPSEIGTGPGMLQFPQKVPINPLQTFNLQLQFPASSLAMGVSTALRATLYGTYETAVAAG